MQKSNATLPANGFLTLMETCTDCCPGQPSHYAKTLYNIYNQSHQMTTSLCAQWWSPQVCYPSYILKLTNRPKVAIPHMLTSQT